MADRERRNWKQNILYKEFKAMMGVLRWKSELDPSKKPLSATNVEQIADYCISTNFWADLLEENRDLLVDAEGHTLEVGPTLRSLINYFEKNQPAEKITPTILANLANRAAHGSAGKDPIAKKRGDWNGIESQRDRWAARLEVNLPHEATDVKEPVQIARPSNHRESSYGGTMYDLKQDLEVIRNRIDDIIGKIR